MKTLFTYHCNDPLAIVEKWRLQLEQEETDEQEE